MIFVVDPGHGGSDPGAVYKGLSEKDVTLDIAKRLVKNASGYNIKLTREDDSFVSLQDRCRISNDLKASFFLSVHCNADPDIDGPGMPEAKGEEIWVYGSRRSRECGKILATYVDECFPNEPFRGVKETNRLYVIKYTVAPACLVETGFIDNSSTWRHFQRDETREEISRWLAMGIMAIHLFLQHGDKA